MKYAISIVSSLALGLWAMGCGDSHTGDDAGGIMLMDSGGGGTDGGGGGTDGGGGGTDGGGGGTDGSVGDDGGIVLMDGGGVRVDGGTVGIDCMGVTCNAMTEQCCITRDPGGGGAMGTCIASDAMCMGATAACDGPEDCGGGEVCCARVGLGGASTTCEASAMCASGAYGPFELCHAPADCTDGTDMCCPVMMFGFSGAYCSPMCRGIGP